MKLTRKITVYFAGLSLACIAAGAFAQTAQTQQSAQQKTLNRHQLSQLIATAKTSADHSTIAQYYETQASAYLAQSEAAATKIHEYKKSPFIGNCVMCVSSSYSVEAAIRSLRTSEQVSEARAAKLQQLAQQQEQMARINTVSAVTMGQ